MSVFASENLEKYRQDLTVQYPLKGFNFHFNTTWGIFSPRAIDEGSQLLLNHLEINPDEHCLDVGCGYGPIGICIAKQAPQGSCVMLDKDFVAVEYAQKNIKSNALTNCEAILSNGFNQLDKDRKYSLIVSNLPAKVGNEMTSLLLHDAYHSLEPGGRLVVVHIGGLKNFIKRGFKEVFGNYKKIKQGKIYTVAQAVKPEK